MGFAAPPPAPPSPQAPETGTPAQAPEPGTTEQDGAPELPQGHTTTEGVMVVLDSADLADEGGSAEEGADDLLPPTSSAAPPGMVDYGHAPPELPPTAPVQAQEPPMLRPAVPPQRPTPPPAADEADGEGTPPPARAKGGKPVAPRPVVQEYDPELDPALHGGGGKRKPKARKRPARGGARGDKRAGAGVFFLLVLVLVAGFIGYQAFSGEASDVPPLEDAFGATSSAPPSTSTSAPPPTGSERAGVAIEFGPKDRGGQGTGAEVIAAYQHAYYVGRSVDGVLRFYSAPVDAAGRTDLQGKIDANPPGTEYRLKVTPEVPGERYSVELTVLWPGQKPLTATTVYRVTWRDGKYYVTGAE